MIGEDELGLERGTIKATVLIETLPAAFEMDAILYELRDHAAGLNAGRWDYIFSTIKRFRQRPDFVLPGPGRGEDDRAVHARLHGAAREDLPPARRARDGRHGGGDPEPQDPEANERAYAAVREDKRREASDGFDGTWVAHPDSVEVAMAEFDEVLGERPNQVERQRDDVAVGEADLLAVSETPGEITEAGLRSNVNVGIQYISSWLRGNGAAAIYGLMEDAATAEISRSPGVAVDPPRSAARRTAAPSRRTWCGRSRPRELERIRTEIGDDEWFETQGRPQESRELFEQVALSGADEFVEFLTLPAYERLED